MLDGRCLCGQIEYEIAGEVGPIDFCHCSYCRRASGIPSPTDDDRSVFHQRAFD